MSWDDRDDEKDRLIRRLKERIEKLEEENSKLRDDRDHAEFRVRNELEPLLAEKRRAYDAYITNPERCWSEEDEE